MASELTVPVLSAGPFRPRAEAAGPLATKLPPEDTRAKRPPSAIVGASWHGGSMRRAFAPGAGCPGPVCGRPAREALAAR
jgi:hypothetical protein